MGIFCPGLSFPTIVNYHGVGHLVAIKYMGISESIFFVCVTLVLAQHREPLFDSNKILQVALEVL